MATTSAYCVAALRDAAGSSECGHGATTVLSPPPEHREALQGITSTSHEEGGNVEGRIVDKHPPISVMRCPLHVWRSAFGADRPALEHCAAICPPVGTVAAAESPAGSSGCSSISLFEVFLS